MRSCSVLLALALCRAYSPASLAAQDSGLLQLTAAVRQHPVILRSLNGADRISFRWTGVGFSWDRPVVHSLLPITIDEVKRSGTELHLKGRRIALYADGQGGWTEGGPLGPVEIVVEMGAAPLDEVAGSLIRHLFFPGWRAALAEAPSWLGGGVSSPAARYAPGLTLSKEATCDCAAVGKPACAGKTPSRKVVAPLLIWRMPPEIPHGAQVQKVSGSVALAFVVNEDGKVTDPWLLPASGYGLDESAAEAILRARFFPAQCHRTPIALPMQMSSSFGDFSYLPHR